MSDDQQLAAFGGGDHQPGQRRQQLRMQAGLRLVQHHQPGRSGAQQGGDQQQVAQRAVGQLGARQRPQQPGAVEPQIEAARDRPRPTAVTRERRRRPGRTASSRRRSRRMVCTRRGQVAARRGRAPGCGCRSGPAGPERGRRSGSGRRTARSGPGSRTSSSSGACRRVADLGEHALVAEEVCRHRSPSRHRALRVRICTSGPSRLTRMRRRAHGLARPDQLPLDLRIEVEGRARARWDARDRSGRRSRPTAKPSCRLTGLARVVPCSGCSPRRTAPLITSGPAQSADGQAALRARARRSPAAPRSRPAAAARGTGSTCRCRWRR